MRPPELILFSTYGGDWEVYEQELHNIFINEIAQTDLQFRGQRVGYRRTPKFRGRSKAFWHLIQEGRVEDERTPDLRRCERLRWVPWVIENAASQHDEIEQWRNRRRNVANTLLWYREEYLVVLAKRSDYWLLITAYCTSQRRRVEQLRRERDSYYHAVGRGGQKD